MHSQLHGGARPLPPAPLPLRRAPPILHPPTLPRRHRDQRPRLGPSAPRAARRAPPPRLRRLRHVAVGPVPPQAHRRRPGPHRPGPPLLRRLLIARPRPLRDLPGQDPQVRHGRHRRAAVRGGRRQLRRLRGVPYGRHVPGGGGADGAGVRGRVPGGERPLRGAVPGLRRRGGRRAARPAAAG